MYGPHHLGKFKYPRRENKPSCPILQIRIWSGHGFFFPLLKRIILKPQMAWDPAFCIWGLPLLQPWAQVTELSRERVSDRAAKAALGLPRTTSDLQDGSAGTAANELLKLEQLYPHFTCLSARTFELQPTSPFVVPQWSSKLKFKVVLALEIVVVVNQVSG